MVIFLSPNDADAYYNRAYAHETLGNLLDAMRDYEKAIELLPEDSWAYGGLAGVYITLDKNSEAIDLLSKAILLDSQKGLYYYNRGVAYYNSGLYNEACSDWRQADKRNYPDAKIALKEDCR